MSEAEDIPLTVAFGEMQSGDQQAAAALWGHFFPRLLGLARHVLRTHRLAVIQPEDAAQSAFASFWHKAEKGGFEQNLNRNDLWKIMATITVRKARRHLARELTDKRGGGKVRNESSLGSGAEGDFRLDQEFALLRSGEFDLACEELLGNLESDELRSIAVYRLMDYSNREIAVLLDCTERRIERKLQVIRTAWREAEGETA
jgi:DNA-directed RNA polymerase specialized sigma24 family protein